MRLFSVFFFCLFCSFFSHAQTPHPWEAGGAIGLGDYKGDLQETKTAFKYFSYNPALSVFLRRHLNNNFVGRADLSYIRLSANDNDFPVPEWRLKRGISFKSSLIELTANLEIYPFGLYKKMEGDVPGLSPQRRKIAPYASLGLGGVYFNPKVNWNDANGNEALNPDKVQTDKDNTKKIAVSIPMGAGIRFPVGDRLSLGLGGALRYTPTDYLDGVSVAGNPDANDWFFTVQLTGSYSFGEPRKKTVPDENSTAIVAPEKSPMADTDGDGLTDDKDACPNVAGLITLQGCPDTDHDGIADKDDNCPDLAGLSSLHGCPDRDGDGIADKDDNCPDLKGVLAYQGCPNEDRDNDGVADAVDLCPDMSGQMKWNGCPDSDNDGLPDNKDDCPGIAGTEKMRGCPDTDQDGIADKDDNCPTIAGSVAMKGCPETIAPSTGIRYKAVYFGATAQEWQNNSVVTLDEAVVILKKDPTLFASIEGHTDNTGEGPANNLLSEKRAKKCYDYLVSMGIDATRLNYRGFGDKNPAVPNDSTKNKQLNRRVEVHFYKK